MITSSNGMSLSQVPQTLSMKYTSCLIIIIQGGFYTAQLMFPSDFPNNPPKMKFKTEMWHPNSKNLLNVLNLKVEKDGTVCISILHAPGKD